jgi:protein-tyrosine phosphatase
MIGWIDTDDRFRLAIMPRPIGGAYLERSIRRLRAAGIDIVVSLLTDDQIQWQELEREGELCAAHGIELRRLPIEDHRVPADRGAAIELCRDLHDQLRTGRAAAVHCLAGIGRSGMITALTLCLAGFDLADACRRISDARGVTCPETHDQLAWLRTTVAAL